MSTWLLADDSASEDELRELAAEQRLLAFGERMAVHAGVGRVSVSGTTRIPGKDEPWSWLRRLRTYLTTGWWPSC